MSLSGQEETLRAGDVQGLKYLKKLLPLLQELHDVGCERDRAGNRKLHYDQYGVLVLLFLFSPVMRSLRALQQASTLRKVQRKLGVARTSLGSLSEATDVFDPERLQGIISGLVSQAQPIRQIGQGHLAQVLTAVDGSVVNTLASIAQAAYHRDRNGQSHSGWRFHTHFEIDRSIPVRMDVTAARNGGHSEEKHQLRQHLAPDRCYVMDRWYHEFALWNDIVAARSSYVCRVRDHTNLNHVLEERPLSEAARQAGVLADRVLQLGTNRRRTGQPDHPVRVILIQVQPRQPRRKGGPPRGPRQRWHPADCHQLARRPGGSDR